MFWLFGPKACGILTPWPGMEPTPPALEGEVLTTGLPFLMAGSMASVRHRASQRVNRCAQQKSEDSHQHDQS